MPKKAREAAAKVNLEKIPRDNPDDVIAMIQGTLGGEGVVIQRGQDLEGRMDLRRPSGITSLDLACGGGLPAGGMSQIDGVDGVGKNLLLNHYFARAQRIYGDACNIAMVCFESVYDKSFGRKCGVHVALSDYEIEQVKRERAATGKPPLTKAEEEQLATDQVGNFHIIRGHIAEKVLQAVAELVASNAFQIIGIDSWDAMLPSAMNEKELEDAAKVADAANVQTRWMSKVFGALNPQKICPECYSRPLEFKNMGNGNYTYICQDCKWKGKNPYMWENETTIIGIRQVRANLNKAGMHAREYKVSGSYALRHGKLIDIQLRRGENITESNSKIGKEINWEITKGKAGTHEGITGSYRYYFDPPKIDTTADLASCALGYELIKGGGPAGYKFGDRELGKKDQIVDALNTDIALRKTLREAVYNAAGLAHVRFK